jgi:general stress protein 26
MKIETQSRPELIQLAGLLENMSVAMLTNIDADGALATRPMSALQMDVDGALWFFTDLRSAKVESLRAVNLSFSDPVHGTYVSLSGRGEISVDREHIERLWTPLARPWFPDGPLCGDIALLKVVPGTAEYWDAPNSRMVRLFAMAASMVARRPIGMGEHGTLAARPALAHQS